MNGPRSQSSPTSSVPHGVPRSGSTTVASKPGAGRPNDPRRCSGCSVSSGGDEAHAAGLGHAEHRVAQPGIGGPDVARHDRVEVAAPDRGEIARRERRVVGEVRDRLREAVHHGRPFALQHVEHAGRGRRVGAHGPAAGDERSEQHVRESADPEERRVREEHVVGAVAPDLVEVGEVADQRAVGVDDALGLAASSPRCAR